MSLNPSNGWPVVTDEPCQSCGHIKSEKVLFRNKPLCATWKPCARRISRRNILRLPDGRFATRAQVRAA